MAQKRVVVSILEKGFGATWVARLSCHEGTRHVVVSYLFAQEKCLTALFGLALVHHLVVGPGHHGRILGHHSQILGHHSQILGHRRMVARREVKEITATEVKEITATEAKEAAAKAANGVSRQKPKRQISCVKKKEN